MKKCMTCDREHYAKGYCRAHYKRLNRGSDPATPLKREKEQHGMARTPEYFTWIRMVSRCTNPKETGYKYWGGRGIKVCNRWLNSFMAFYEDMGKKPSPQHSIDRIDNNGNYEPGNCRWATRTEQSANQFHGNKYKKREVMG